MGPLAVLSHLSGFVAPALALAALLALAARLVLPERPGLRSMAWRAALNALAGTGVLLAGLWWFGRDGKMATYGALVLVMATVQWLLGRGWRR